MEKGKPGVVIWFTGLPSSGKTTLALHLKSSLEKKGLKTFLLDGDQLRAGLNSDLGFSHEDRSENIRRAAEVALLFCEEGYIVLSAFISPFSSDRESAKKIIGPYQFVEVFVKCPLAVCEQRDVKGLYRKARAGLISDFTGIDSPYEEPLHADIVVETNNKTIAQAKADLEMELKRRGAY